MKSIYNLSQKELEKHLEDVDHLMLLEVVMKKYKDIGQSVDCGYSDKKNKDGQCTYELFHKEIGDKLNRIINECNRFHGVSIKE